MTVCHASSIDSTIWPRLYQLDKLIAEEVQSCNCPYCGAVLHVAMYPRKPRGVSRPPSVRFLGRKVYLGVMVVLAAAAAQGLNDQRYKKLVEHLSLSRYTLQRWLTWWQEQLPETPFWRQLQGRVPSISQIPLPTAILDRLAGDVLVRCQRLLVTLMPLTTQSPPRGELHRAITELSQKKIGGQVSYSMLSAARRCSESSCARMEVLELDSC